MKESLQSSSSPDEKVEGCISDFSAAASAKELVETPLEGDKEKTLELGINLKEEEEDNAIKSGGKDKLTSCTLTEALNEKEDVPTPSNSSSNANSSIRKHQDVSPLEKDGEGQKRGNNRQSEELDINNQSKSSSSEEKILSPYKVV